MKTKHVKNLFGMRFNKLLVLEFHHTDKNHAYWLCKCDCGKEKIIRGNSLPTSQSCGCTRSFSGYHVPKPQQKRIYQHSIDLEQRASKWLWQVYRKGATKRRLSFNLSLEDFSSIIKCSCHYCGKPPKQKLNLGKNIYFYNGVDRKDNSMGYEINNVVPCCKSCNYAKKEMSYDDFISWLDSLVSYRSNLNR